MTTCKRCNYEWRTRTDATPKACPNCRSRSWDTPAGKKGKYCPECPHCNPIPSRRKYTEAELNDPELFPEDCICRGAHRPDSTVCPVNQKGELT